MTQRLTRLAVVVLLAHGPLGAPGTGPRHGDQPTIAPPRYYVALGDSYAVGFQPGESLYRHGYANQVVNDARRRGQRLQLVNFGCNGATTTTLLDATSCVHPATHGAPYGGLSQAAAAERFLAMHRGQIALVTVSIGFNDYLPCVGTANLERCLGQPARTRRVEANVAMLSAGLRAAVGPGVLIVGLTYPDVVLGRWVRLVDRPLAAQSVDIFRTLINPALQEAYFAVGGAFLDVTDATGAYIPLTETVNLKPYGRIPTAVAKICELTYYCRLRDPHPDTNGYRVIADLIVAALPRA